MSGRDDAQWEKPESDDDVNHDSVTPENLPSEEEDARPAFSFRRVFDALRGRADSPPAHESTDAAENEAPEEVVSVPLADLSSTTEAGIGADFAEDEADEDVKDPAEFANLFAEPEEDEFVFEDPVQTYESPALETQPDLQQPDTVEVVPVDSEQSSEIAPVGDIPLSTQEELAETSLIEGSLEASTVEVPAEGEPQVNTTETAVESMPATPMPADLDAGKRDVISQSPSPSIPTNAQSTEKSTPPSSPAPTDSQQALSGTGESNKSAPLPPAETSSQSTPGSTQAKDKSAPSSAAPNPQPTVSGTQSTEKPAPPPAATSSQSAPTSSQPADKSTSSSTSVSNPQPTPDSTQLTENASPPSSAASSSQSTPKPPVTTGSQAAPGSTQSKDKSIPPSAAPSSQSTVSGIQSSEKAAPPPAATSSQSAPSGTQSTNKSAPSSAAPSPQSTVGDRQSSEKTTPPPPAATSSQSAPSSTQSTEKASPPPPAASSSQSTPKPPVTTTGSQSTSSSTKSADKSAPSSASGSNSQPMAGGTQSREKSVPQSAATSSQSAPSSTQSTDKTAPLPPVETDSQSTTAEVKPQLVDAGEENENRSGVVSQLQDEIAPPPIAPPPPVEQPPSINPQRRRRANALVGTRPTVGAPAEIGGAAASAAAIQTVAPSVPPAYDGINPEDIDRAPIFWRWGDMFWIVSAYISVMFLQAQGFQAADTLRLTPSLITTSLFILVALGFLVWAINTYLTRRAQGRIQGQGLRIFFIGQNSAWLLTLILTIIGLSVRSQSAAQGMVYTIIVLALIWWGIKLFLRINNRHLLRSYDYVTNTTIFAGMFMMFIFAMIAAILMNVNGGTRLNIFNPTTPFGTLNVISLTLAILTTLVFLVVVIPEQLRYTDNNNRLKRYVEFWGGFMAGNSLSVAGLAIGIAIATQNPASAVGLQLAANIITIAALLLLPYDILAKVRDARAARDYKEIYLVVMILLAVVITLISLLNFGFALAADNTTNAITAIVASGLGIVSIIMEIIQLWIVGGEKERYRDWTNIITNVLLVVATVMAIMGAVGELNSAVGAGKLGYAITALVAFALAFGLKFLTEFNLLGVIWNWLGRIGNRIAASRQARAVRLANVGNENTSLDNVVASE